MREKIEKNRKRQKGIFDRALRYKQTGTNQKWQSQLKQGKKEFEAALTDKQRSSDLFLALKYRVEGKLEDNESDREKLEKENDQQKSRTKNRS